MKRWAFVLLVCSGCHLGPPYEPPSPCVPPEWKHSEERAAPPTVPISAWWEVFDDPCLNQLEERAVATSPEIAIAVQRVAEARALACVQKGAMAPQVTFNPQYSNTSQLFQFFGPASFISLFNLARRVFRIHQLWYSLPVNVSYELDLWGKLHGRYESAFRTAEAECFAKQAACLSLTTELATSYFTLRYLDAQILFYRKSIAELTASVDLTTSRFHRGLVSYLDVAAASRQLTRIQSDMEELIRQRGLQENQIALLIGQPASCLTLPPLPLPNRPPPAIPETLPANLLLRRPDLAEAERRAASEHALIGVAYAAFFPSVSLSIGAGFLSPDKEDFLSWLSRYLSYAISGGQDLSVGGRDRANLCAAWARFCRRANEYQQQVLTAFREVEDALNNLETEERQFEDLTENARWAFETVSLSRDRYERGLVGYLDVIDSQNSALESERNLIGLQGVRYLSTVQLIKALGGCW